MGPAVFWTTTLYAVIWISTCVRIHNDDEAMQVSNISALSLGDPDVCGCPGDACDCGCVCGEGDCDCNPEVEDCSCKALVEENFVAVRVDDGESVDSARQTKKPEMVRLRYAVDVGGWSESTQFDECSTCDGSTGEGYGASLVEFNNSMEHGSRGFNVNCAGNRPFNGPPNCVKRQMFSRVCGCMNTAALAPAPHDQRVIPSDDRLFIPDFGYLPDEAGRHSCGYPTSYALWRGDECGEYLQGNLERNVVYFGQSLNTAMRYVRKRGSEKKKDFAYWYQYKLMERLHLIEINSQSTVLIQFLNDGLQHMLSHNPEEFNREDLFEYRRKCQYHVPYDVEHRYTLLGYALAGAHVVRDSYHPCDKAWGRLFCRFVVRQGYHGYIAGKLFWSTASGKCGSTFHEEVMICYPKYVLSGDWYARETL